MTTNFDRIKNMTLEEMAKFLDIPCGMGPCMFCVGCPEDIEHTCEPYIKQWLQSENEEV